MSLNAIRRVDGPRFIVSAFLFSKPVQPRTGSVTKPVHKKPRRKPGQQYDVASYRRAITRGCDLASPWPQLNGRCIKDLTEGEQVQRKAWHREHRWHPHQLRHNAGTFLRQEFGIEAARLILGHRSVSITELYAELDHRKAIEIMAEVG